MSSQHHCKDKPQQHLIDKKNLAIDDDGTTGYDKKLTKYLEKLRRAFAQRSWVIEDGTLYVLREYYLQVIKEMVEKGETKKKQLKMFVKSICTMVDRLAEERDNEHTNTGDVLVEEPPVLKVAKKTITTPKSKWQFWFWKSDQRYFKWDYGLQPLCRPIDSSDRLHYVLEQLLDIGEIVLPSDYSFFREGVKPKWEDKFNMQGGSWIIEFDRTTIDWHLVSLTWKRLLAMVFDTDKHVLDDIFGIKISMRFKNYLINIWFRDFTSLPVNVAMGKLIGGVLDEMGVTEKAKIFYRAHTVAEQSAILKERLKFGISHSVPL